MKKAMGRKIFGYLILLILTFSITLGAGAYKTAKANERAQFQADVISLENAPIMLDLAEQGLAKRMIQPGLVQISTGHGGGGVHNSSEKALPIQVKLANFATAADFTLDAEADQKTGKLLEPLEPDGSFGMSIEFNISRKDRHRLIAASGEIQFLDATEGTLLGKIPVYIVNSKYGDPSKELQITQSTNEAHHHGGGH